MRTTHSASPVSGRVSRVRTNTPVEPISYEEALARLAGEERGGGWLAYCERRGVFQWPVIEWADALAGALMPLGAKRPLEVGAGGGTLGRAIRERGLPFILTDPEGAADSEVMGDVERLNVEEALETHRPDLVLSCWLPFDLGAEKIIFADGGVRWYLAIVQTGPGFAGSEALWGDHGWNARRVEEADRWSVSRADYLTEVSHGDHIRHGASFLFSRKD